MTSQAYLDWNRLRAQIGRTPSSIGTGFITRLRAYRAQGAPREARVQHHPSGARDPSPGTNARNLAVVLRLSRRVSHTS